MLNKQSTGLFIPSLFAVALARKRPCSDSLFECIAPMAEIESRAGDNPGLLVEDRHLHCIMQSAGTGPSSYNCFEWPVVCEIHALTMSKCVCKFVQERMPIHVLSSKHM